MINNIKETTEILKVKEKSINYDRLSSNVTTGDKDYLYPKLKQSFKTATTIDIIVSFLMESGVKLLLQDLKEALNRGVKIRLLTRKLPKNNTTTSTIPIKIRTKR